jgi:hypothetical protein
MRRASSCISALQSVPMISRASASPSSDKTGSERRLVRFAPPVNGPAQFSGRCWLEHLRGLP